jgi:dTDP-L-rhamnose 4-epimerase
VNVLITGGAGFIGSHLSEALVQAGHRIIVFDNLHPQVHPHSRFPAYLTGKVDFIFGDIRNRDLLKKAIGQAEVVYHLAALTGTGQSMYKIADYVDLNVGGTATLLDILVGESNHVRRLILASSRAIYGEGAYECKSCGAVPVVARDTSLLAVGKWNPPCQCCGADLHPQPTSEKWQPHPSSVYATTKLAQEHLALSGGHTGWKLWCCAISMYMDHDNLSQILIRVSCPFF